MASSLKAAIALLTLAATAGFAHADIAIGVAGPMSGKYEIFGTEMRTGAAKAVADINAAGGVLGEKLVLEAGDDACDPQRALAIANQMVGKGIAFMDGHFCSDTSITASSVYAEAKVVEISPASSNPKYTDERPGPGIFRLAGRADQQAVVSGKYLATHFADKNIAIIDDGSTYGKGLADQTRLVMNAAGKKETLTDTYRVGESDYSDLVYKLKAANIDVVYIGGYQTEAGLIRRQMAELGVNAVMMGGDPLMTEEFWATAGKAANGTLVTFPPDPRKNPEAAGVVKEFRDKGIEPEGYVLASYAAVQTWAEAAKAAGSTDFDAVVAALGQGTFDTVLGSFTFDAKGDASLPAYVVYEWRDGNYDYAPQ